MEQSNDNFMKIGYKIDISEKFKNSDWYYPALNFVRDQDDPDDHERIIHKNGLCNVSQHTPRSQKIFIFRYSKLVDSSWLFTLSVFLAVLFASWFTFALLYFVICYTHGDLEPDHLPENQEANGYNFLKWFQTVHLRHQGIFFLLLVQYGGATHSGLRY